MSISWDPKVGSTGRTDGSTTADAGAPAKKPLVTPEAMEKPKSLPTPETATTHPAMQARPQPIPFEREVSQIKELLRGQRAEREQAATRALGLCAGYAMRRSKNGRKLGQALCDEVGQQLGDMRPAAQRLKAILAAEGQLHELGGEATAAAAHALIVLLEDEDRPKQQRDPRIEALLHATLAHALIQLAVHFPVELLDVGLTIESALERALGLAEEAVALAPDLPDGHSAIGRLLLCHDGDDAIDDAVELLEHAQRLDPEHDPALAALAAAYLELGRADEALALVDKVLRRGNQTPHALMLRAIVHVDLGRFEEARRDLDRALRLAPGAGMLHLDAARIAVALGDDDAAHAYAEHARVLLDTFYDDFAAGLFERATE